MERGCKFTSLEQNPRANQPFTAKPNNRQIVHVIGCFRTTYVPYGIDMLRLVIIQ